MSTLKRIQAALKPWETVGTGTYKADYIDYGDIPVAILRDIRWLVGYIGAQQDVLQQFGREAVDAEARIEKFEHALKKIERLASDPGWFRGYVLDVARAALDEKKDSRTPLCALCGRPTQGFATVDRDGVTTRLCHTDEAELTCYERWTTYGERP